jgi:antitoxin component of MazEF toxin-antitoxin module
MKFLTTIFKNFSTLFNFMQMKVQKIGSSVFVRLPLDFVRYYNLREVGFVNLKENDDGDLVISAKRVSR